MSEGLEMYLIAVGAITTVAMIGWCLVAICAGTSHAISQYSQRAKRSRGLPPPPQ